MKNLISKFGLIGMLTSLFAMGAPEVTGTVTVNSDDLTGTLNDTVTISGDAAKKIYNDLKVEETTKKEGSLFLTSKIGDQIKCTFSAEIRATYGCVLSIGLKDGKVADQKK